MGSFLVLEKFTRRTVDKGGRGRCIESLDTHGQESPDKTGKDVPRPRYRKARDNMRIDS